MGYLQGSREGWRKESIHQLALVNGHLLPACPRGPLSKPPDSLSGSAFNLSSYMSISVVSTWLGSPLADSMPDLLLEGILKVSTLSFQARRPGYSKGPKHAI